MDPSQVNWLAALVAATSSFFIGGLWYSPLLFAKPWARLNGLAEEDLGRGMAKVFAGAFVCQLVAAVNLAFFIGGHGDWTFGVFAGFAAGLGWVAMGLTTTYLFERRPFALLLIDVGYHVVALTVMGTILGLWR